jgi:cytochrome-b5 reductase
VYPDGKFSQHLASLPLGQTVDFKHIGPNVKLQYPVGKKKVGLICGGTGVTPMLQALHALLGTTGDATEVSMLYGSVHSGDVLAGKELDAWAAASKGRFAVHHVLSSEPEGSNWAGLKGYINKDLVKAHLPAPGDDCVILVCGPPPMTAALCGPREAKEVTGALKELGFRDDQVYKF